MRGRVRAVRFVAGCGAGPWWPAYDPSIRWFGTEETHLPPTGAIEQGLLREVNEQIARIDGYFDEDLELVCECRDCCFEHVILPRDHYQAIRRFPTRLLVKPGHRSIDERVVEDFRTYLVVENVEVADELKVDFRHRTMLGSES
jgi:hypothetical protein